MEMSRKSLLLLRRATRAATRPFVSCYDLVRRLAGDRRGSVFVIVAIAIVPLIGFVGLATDTARGYLVKAKLSHAIDAAGLAGGRAMLEPDRDDDIRMFFDANYPEGFLGSIVNGPVIIADEEAGTLTITASATMPTSFMTVMGFDNIDVEARTVVHRSVRGMELALVMDTTGSMRGGGKIGAMRDAAHALVDELYGDDEVVLNFWVSLVPYGAMVNIGNQRTDWLETYNPEDWLPAAWDTNAEYETGDFASYDDVPYLAIDESEGERPDMHPTEWQEFDPIEWKGCVEARAEPDDATDVVPATEGFMPTYWQSTLHVYPGAGDNDWDWANIDEENGAQNDGLGPNLGCGPAITPLVAPKSTVTAAIDEMLPWHRGGTMANLGLAWGWRTISPEWRGLWGGASPAELPLDYDEPLMDKVIVVLTDGNNQWYDWPGGLPGKPQYGSYPDADYTAYGRLSEDRLGTGTIDNGDARDEINIRMSALCNAIKARGVIIYAITFRLNNAGTQQLYRDCATSTAHYFNSPSNAALQETFEEIGNQLTNLRLAE